MELHGYIQSTSRPTAEKIDQMNIMKMVTDSAGQTITHMVLSHSLEMWSQSHLSDFKFSWNIGLVY